MTTKHKMLDPAAVAEIQARHDAIKGNIYIPSGKSAYAYMMAAKELPATHTDRAALLASHEALQAELEKRATGIHQDERLIRAELAAANAEAKRWKDRAELERDAAEVLKEERDAANAEIARLRALLPDDYELADREARENK